MGGFGAILSFASVEPIIAVNSSLTIFKHFRADGALRHSVYEILYDEKVDVRAEKRHLHGAHTVSYVFFRELAFVFEMLERFAQLFRERSADIEVEVVARELAVVLPVGVLLVEGSAGVEV